MRGNKKRKINRSRYKKMVSNRRRKRHRRMKSNQISRWNGKWVLCVLILIIIGFYLSLTHFNQLIVPYEQLANFYLNEQSIKHIENYSTIKQKEPYTYFAAYLADKDYDAKSYSVTDVNHFLNNIKWYHERKIENYYKKSGEVFKKALEDVKVFPLNCSNNEYTYEDTYGASRTYGGKRSHLGTDVMDVNNKRGRLEIVSMTDGVVANMGWNEKGGWRIGINTPNGTYFYYAHLERYVEGIQEGMEIHAGDVLGYMGDSGYGVEPGTVGKFPVHLHLGIMLRDVLEEEYWINPYFILKYVEEN